MPILEKAHSLSSKNEITVGPEKLASSSKNHVTFYMKYSSFVFRSSRRSSILKVHLLDVEKRKHRRANGQSCGC